MSWLLVMIAIVIVIVLYNYNTNEGYEYFSNFSGGPNYRWPGVVGPTPLINWDRFPYQIVCQKKAWPK